MNTSFYAVLDADETDWKMKKKILIGIIFVKDTVNFSGHVKVS